MKVEGVESVSVSLQRASAELQLRAGNRVGLEQLRQIVKNNGFVPKEASVTVVGTLVERGGKPALDVTHLGVVWLVAEDAKNRAAYATAVELAGGRQSASVEVTGEVRPAAGSTPETIALQSIRAVPK
jgi:hypothetical protein